MGACTKGILKGKVSHLDVENYISQIGFKVVSNQVKCGDISYSGKEWHRASGSIFVQVDDDNTRMLFFYYSTYSPPELYEGVTPENHTHLSLGCDDEAKWIIKKIVGQFGGWFLENDCSSSLYEPVIKDANGNIRPVLHVTLQEVYEKFGSVVVITDK